MILSELFKSDGSEFKYDVTKYSTDWNAVTKLDNGKRVEIECFKDRHTGAWEILFNVDGSHQKTNRGDEIEVFKRVTFLLQKFKESVDPAYITFESHGDSRTSLYKRMFTRALPGWHMTILKVKGGDQFTIAPTDPFPVAKPWKNVGLVMAGAYYVTFYKDPATEAHMDERYLNYEKVKDDFVMGNMEREYKEYMESK